MKKLKNKNKNQRKNHKLDLQDRLLIENLKNEEGNNISKIARILHATRKTIRKELGRIKGIYSAVTADAQAKRKQKLKTKDWKKIVSFPNLRAYVEEKMKLDWSPEEISGRIHNIDKHIAYVSTKAIYNFIYSVYGRKLEKYLRYGKQKDRFPVTDKEKWKGRVFIDKRPKKVEKRAVFGDWEADFICSGKSGTGYLLVFVERKTRYIIIRRILRKDVSTVQVIFSKILGVKYIVNTLTLDNDIVFRKHEEFSKTIGAPVFFTQPYHSWEKGTVENMNKWIRQYIPKKSDISSYSDEFIQEIEDKLNSRPRKCLQYKMPKEALALEKHLKKEISMIQSHQIFTRLNVLKN